MNHTATAALLLFGLSFLAAQQPPPQQRRISWDQRLAARTGRPARPPPAEPPQPAPTPPGLSDAVRRELRDFVASTVEPAIAVIRAHEASQNNQEECFASAAGQHLRYRCCVYFSALTAALLEWRFGEGGNAIAGGAAGSAPPDRRTLYGLLARWFLQPPGSAPQAWPLSTQLHAEAGRADAYDLAALRAAAGRLPGPLGRYHAQLSVRGVRGTLWRCEVSTTHSYLVFEAAGHDDVLVDVSFKQFLVIPEWMGVRHFEACRQQPRLFDDVDDAFVGTHAELDALMTLPALGQAMRDVYERAGDATHDAPFSDAVELHKMHHLRNRVLFATHDVALRRSMCGKPTQ